VLFSRWLDRSSLRKNSKLTVRFNPLIGASDAGNLRRHLMLEGVHFFFPFGFVALLLRSGPAFYRLASTGSALAAIEGRFEFLLPILYVSGSTVFLGNMYGPDLREKKK